MAIVYLIRGPLETLTYHHATLRAAENRADALAELHGVMLKDVAIDRQALTVTVDASAYYADAKPHDPSVPRPSRRKVPDPRPTPVCGTFSIPSNR